MTLIELFKLYPTLPPEEQLKLQYALNYQQRQALKQYLSLAGAAEQSEQIEEEKQQQEEDRKLAEQQANPLYQLGIAAGGAVGSGLGLGLGQNLASGSLFGGGAAAAAPATPALLSATGTGAAAAPGVPGIVSASTVPTGALGSAGAAGAGTATTGGATGAAASPGLLASAGPIAAALAGGAGMIKGAHEGLQTFNQGGGKQQEGAIQIANSLFSPLSGFNEFLGEPIDSKTFNQVTGLLHPVAMPLAIADMLGVNFWSGKDEDQVNRDAVRSGWQNAGLLDENYNFDFGGGVKFDAGKDGGAMLANTDGGQRHTYDIDWSRADAGDLAGAGNVFALASGVYDPKAVSDAAGLWANAVTSGGDQSGNIKSSFDKLGGHDKIYNSILSAYDAGKIDENRRDAALAEIDKQYKPKPAKGLQKLGAR